MSLCSGITGGRSKEVVAQRIMNAMKLIADMEKVPEEIMD